MSLRCSGSRTSASEKRAFFLPFGGARFSLLKPASSDSKSGETGCQGSDGSVFQREKAPGWRPKKGVVFVNLRPTYSGAGVCSDVAECLSALMLMISVYAGSCEASFDEALPQEVSTPTLSDILRTHGRPERKSAVYG
jgi:hypothetical protein